MATVKTQLKMMTALMLGSFMLFSGMVGAATGSIEGTIEVKERSFFGGLQEKKNHSGVLVYLSGFKTPAPSNVVRLKQRQKTFLPSILPVVVGQRVEFPNEDDIYHNVFSVAPKGSFDLGQYKRGDEAKVLQFDLPGLVPVFCNIHPQMIAYIAVLENDAFAMTDANGKFKIENIPAGTHEVNIWINGAKRVSQKVTIAAGKSTQFSASIQQVLRLQPHKRKDNTEYPSKSIDYPE